MKTLVALLLITGIGLSYLGSGVSQAQDSKEFEDLVQIGVNLAIAEFGEHTLPGRRGYEYDYPSCEFLASWQARGMRLFRIPFRMERVYSRETGRLREEDVRRLEELAECAAKGGGHLILDAHNYGRFEGKIIADEEFARIWGLLAERFAGHRGVAAYDLMNEPFDMPYEVAWPSMAQMAILDIRRHDPETWILAAGDRWSTARFWRDFDDNSVLLLLDDPAGRLIFTAHQYFDDHTGQYACRTPEACGVDEAEAVDRIAYFTLWCREYRVRCFLGETGVPVDEPAWKPVMEAVFRFLLEREIGVTLWAGGPWWLDDYPLNLEVEQADWLIGLAQALNEEFAK